MALDPRKTEALLAILDMGSLEAAAEQLKLTPSAISQRLKALESELGSPLVLRTRPCQATREGRKLVQYLRRRDLLDAEFTRDYHQHEGHELSISIAVNNDTLATWLLPALADFVQSRQLLLNLTLDDQDHTHALMEAGQTLACVSSQAQAMRGCVAEPLGMMRYRLLASPLYQQRWFPDGMTREAARRAPVLVFDRKDRLQANFLARYFGLSDASYPCHYFPATDPFLSAIRLGYGYGMVPEQQFGDALCSGQLVDLAPDKPTDVALYWHRWKIQSPILEQLSSCLIEAARQTLLQPES